MGDKPGKKKKAKPPGVPKGAPKELVDFVDCKGDAVTLKAGKLDWIPKEGLAEFAPDPTVTFEEDKTKPGAVTIKVTLGKTFTLPASVKDGKLEVDTSGIPLNAIKKPIDDWVRKLNDWLAANDRKLAGVKINDGGLVITKVAVAEPAKGGVKAAPFPHVPAWEKAGAVGLLGLSIAFGVGFMDAGDDTTTRTERVCPEAAGPGRSVGAGPDCPQPQGSDEVPPVRPEGLVAQIGDVYISVAGGQPTPGTIRSRTDETLSFVVPLFAIGQSHRVEFWDSSGAVIDEFAFTVPSASGAAPPIATQQGGRAECDVDHQNPVPPGRSGADCLYFQPVLEPIPEPQPNDGDGAVEPETRTVEVETDGTPWSLLAIPGAALGLLGGLALEEERRRREGGWDAGSQTYPDWDATYPDWYTAGGNGPSDPSPDPRPGPPTDSPTHDVM